MAQTFYKDTDGMSVDVDLIYTITGERPIYVSKLVGLPFQSGDSGDTVAMRADGTVHQWKAPAALTLAIGDTVYVDASDVGNAHEIPDAAFTTTAGGDTYALFRVLSLKDANNWCIVKLINF
jgi:hypothetical protein